MTYSTWRNAQTTTDVSTGGFSLFQSAYIDANGKIDSFTSGSVDNKVDKYFSPSLLEIRYKRNASPLLFMIGDTTSYTWNGTSFTSYSHSSLGTDPIRHAIMFKGEYYVIKGTYDGQLWKSADLQTWSNTGVTYAMSLATDGNVLAVAIVAGSFKYTTNGTTFTTYNTWTDAPYQIMSVRYVNNRWVAVGSYPEPGDFTFRPWVATTTTDISSGWSTYMSPYLGSYDTGFLDVAYVGGNYRYYGVIAAYSSYLQIWDNAGFSFYGDPQYSSSISGFYSMDRSNNNLVAVADGSIVSPIQPGIYMLGLTDYGNSGNPVYCTATDRNNVNYFVVYDGADYLLKDNAFATVATVPGAVYGVGGSK